MTGWPPLIGQHLCNLDTVGLEHAKVVVQGDAPLPILVQLKHVTQLNTELLEHILKAFNENNSQLEVIRSNGKVGAIISSCRDMEHGAWSC